MHSLHPLSLPRSVAVLAAVVALGLGPALGSFAGGSNERVLRVMSHDSWALSEELVAQFERDNGVEVEILTSGDAGSAVNTAILAKGNPIADVLYGIDNTFLSRALEADIFLPYAPPGLAQVPAEFQLDPQRRVVPIDFGDVCLNYDIVAMRERGLPPPASLDELVDERYRGLLVVPSPVTSSPGLAFLLATIGHFGEADFLEFWRRLRANDVLVTGDWESAYFAEFSGASNGSRPLVVSYGSSPPFEVLFAEQTITEPSTAAIVAADTCFRQIEFAGILVGTKNRGLAERWMDFLLTREVQEDLPLNMFVFPVRSDAELNETFRRFLAVPQQPVQVDPARIASERERWIREWRDVMAR